MTKTPPDHVATAGANVGTIMAHLKTSFGGQYDGKAASTLGEIAQGARVAVARMGRAGVQSRAGPNRGRDDP